uniref:hypothetical protein n=1 Tax=Butyrivibrio proteoclasticus TaxID=43305 RepID=UPI0038BA3CE0
MLKRSSEDPCCNSLDSIIHTCTSCMCYTYRNSGFSGNRDINRSGTGHVPLDYLPLALMLLKKPL